MDFKNFENRFKKFNKTIYFDYSIKKLNWFNIGGNTNIYFNKLKILSKNGLALFV